MTYKLGQIIEFTNEIPDDLLEYLNTNNYYLDEIEPVDDIRRVVISEMPKSTVEENKANFEEKFFNIDGVGWYRKAPKGYQSAVESINTAFNMVTVMGMLPANTLTFYTAPDFTDSEQCTEEWLIANSFKNDAMTAQEFGEFYAAFMTAWNNQEHK